LELVGLFLFWTGWVIQWATIIVSGLLFLRVIMGWLGANPFGRVVYNLTRITEPIVRPLRYQFSGTNLRRDLIPLIIGLMILVTGLFVSQILKQFGAVFHEVAYAYRLGLLTGRFLAGRVIMVVGLLYVVAIFLRFVLPLFGIGYRNNLSRFLFVITEPLLKPLRRFFVAGMLDFSPLVAMLIVQIVTGLLAGMFN